MEGNCPEANCPEGFRPLTFQYDRACVVACAYVEIYFEMMHFP